MGKYEPLARYLESRKNDSWTASFEEIEAKLGFPLPKSAHDHRAWWSNQSGPGHSQKDGWQGAGWETREVDLRGGTVRFERNAKSNSKTKAMQSASDLWEKAGQISGIHDRDELINEALTALIQREAALFLGRLGGTMPDAAAPPRRRFDP